MTQQADQTGVIHLVRSGNDPAALNRFITSYRRFSPGAPHRLIFLLKGFGSELPPSVSKLLDIVPHSKLNCPDRGFDLGSYFFAAGRISESVVMFTNSFSVLRSEQWLAKLLDAYRRPGVGLVGATGSWESLSTQCMNAAASTASSRFRMALRHAMGLAMGVPLLALFRPFPNVHLRTNGFLLGRREFLDMRPRMMRTKLDAWLFESGRNSMTRQVLNRGLQVLVVGADGAVYPPSEWPLSNSFWQSQQENLLISDNRTLTYEQGSPALRAALARAAWTAHDSPQKPSKSGDSMR